MGEIMVFNIGKKSSTLDDNAPTAPITEIRKGQTNDNCHNKNDREETTEQEVRIPNTIHSILSSDFIHDNCIAFDPRHDWSDDDIRSSQYNMIVNLMHPNKERSQEEEAKDSKLNTLRKL